MDRRLVDLGAEIHRMLGEDGAQCEALLFVFREQTYLVPFAAERTVLPGIGKVWKQTGGSTVEDLSLSPSYWVKSPPECAIHVWVTDGVVKGLPDEPRGVGG